MLRLGVVEQPSIIPVFGSGSNVELLLTYGWCGVPTMVSDISVTHSRCIRSIEDVKELVTFTWLGHRD